MSIIIITFGLVYIFSLLSFKKALLVFFALIPFYYFPFIFIPNLHDDQWHLLRALKDYIIFAFLLAWITKVLLRKKFFSSNKLLALFIFALMGVGIIKVIYIDDLWLSIARPFIIFPMWYLVMQDVFDDSDELIKFGALFVYSSFLVSVIGFIEFFYLDSETIFSIASGQHRVISTLFNPNALGWYLAGINSLVISFCFLRRQNILSVNYRYYALIIFFCNTVVIVMSGSRSAFVGNFITLFLFLPIIIRSPKAILSVILSLILLLNLIFFWSLDFSSFRVFGENDDARLGIYSSALDILLNNYWSLLLGASHDDLIMVHGLNLLNDSFILWVISVAGVFPVFIILSFGLIVILKLLFTKQRVIDIRLCFGISSVIFLIFGFVGNVQMIFPHGVIFWSFIAVAFSNVGRFVSPKLH